MLSSNLCQSAWEARLSFARCCDQNTRKSQSQIKHQTLAGSTMRVCSKLRPHLSVQPLSLHATVASLPLAHVVLFSRFFSASFMLSVAFFLISVPQTQAPGSRTPVARQSHASRTPVARQSHASRTPVARQSHASRTPVARQSHASRTMPGCGACAPTSSRQSCPRSAVAPNPDILSAHAHWPRTLARCWQEARFLLKPIVLGSEASSLIETHASLGLAFDTAQMSSGLCAQASAWSTTGPFTSL